MPFDRLPDHNLQIRNEQFTPPPVIQRFPTAEIIAGALQPLVTALQYNSPEEKAKRQLQQLELGVEQQKYSYLSKHPEALFPKEAPDPLLAEKKKYYNARTYNLLHKPQTSDPASIYRSKAAAAQGGSGGTAVQQTSTQLPATLNGLFRSDASVDTPDLSNALGSDTPKPSTDFGANANLYNPDYSGNGLNLSDITVPQTYAEVDPSDIPTTSPEDYYANLS